MARLLKILGYAVGALVLLVVVCVGGLYAWSGAEIAKKVPLPTHAFTAPTDAASVARGEHLLRSIVKCGDCHTPDLGGGEVINDPAIGLVHSANLTTGKGGIAGYTDADFERAIRHGVARDGRRLVIMPSNEYQFMSDEDLGAVIAYIRSQAAVDRERPATTIGPLARALYAGGQLPLFPAKLITLDGAVPSVPVDSTVEYGKYLGSIGCAGCHGAGYGGGAIPGGPPDWPKPANLTPAGIGHYKVEGFAHVLRSGERPDGTKLNPFMPIQATKLMTDVEVVAVWKYLQTLPAKPFGSR